MASLQVSAASVGDDNPRPTSAMNSFFNTIFNSPRKEEHTPPRDGSPTPASQPREKTKTSPRKGKAASSRQSNASEPQSPIVDDNKAREAEANKTDRNNAEQSIISAAATKIANLVADTTGVRAASHTPGPASPAAAPKSARKAAQESAAIYDVPASEAGSVTDEHPFTGFVGHRWTGDDIEIEVAWADGPNTWEPEAVLQKDTAQAVYDYWKGQGGRPAHPKDKELYTMFAVLDHSKDRKKLKVQWTGFSPRDATWEPRAAVESSAPALVEDYWKAERTREGPRKARAGKAVARKIVGRGGKQPGKQPGTRRGRPQGRRAR